MTYDELKRIADSAGELSGWDFSRTRTAIDPVPWEYGEVVRRFLRPESRVLDIGTGGGERFVELASDFGTGLGTDASEVMIETARAKLPLGLAGKVSFAAMTAQRLAFPDASFDVVLNRHAPLDAREIHRVLRPGGVFITQQVGPRNTRNIYEVFGADPDTAFGESHTGRMQAETEAFRGLGCAVVARGEYDVRYWFLDVASLLFWMKAIPVPRGFAVETHWRQVDEIVTRYGTPDGIETNEHRELLIVRTA